MSWARLDDRATRKKSRESRQDRERVARGLPARQVNAQHSHKGFSGRGGEGERGNFTDSEPASLRVVAGTGWLAESSAPILVSDSALICTFRGFIYRDFGRFLEQAASVDRTRDATVGNPVLNLAEQLTTLEGPVLLAHVFVQGFDLQAGVESGQFPHVLQHAGALATDEEIAPVAFHDQRLLTGLADRLPS